MRHIERVFQSRIEGAFDLKLPANGRVSVLIHQRKGKRPFLRHLLWLAINPDISPLLRDGESHGISPRQLAGAAQPWNLPAHSSLIELPTVVGALQPPGLHPSQRQRNVAVRAAIDQSRRSST